MNKKIFSKINILLIIVFILVVTYSMIHYMPYWDEAVYTNNGKFLFSGGEISTYEYQRPPIMGLLIGFFWFIGVNEVIFTKILLALIFLIGLFYLYKISEDIKKGSGVVTTLLFASISSMIIFTNRLLTEIPGTSLAIVGYYFFTKRKYFLSGFILSLAFLFRYPAGLVFGILGIFLLIKAIKKRQIKLILKYGVGFSILVVPFVFLNYFLLTKINLPFIQKLTAPFSHASQMVAANAQDLVTNGFVYYLKYLFNQNFLLVFFLLAIVLVLIFKKTRKMFFKENILLPFTIAVVYLLYLSNLVHFEPRYFFSAIPFFVIIAGFGIFQLLEKLKLKKIVLFIEIILLLALIFNFAIAISMQIEDNKINNFENIDNYFEYIQNNDPEYSGKIAVDEPLYGVYNEKNKIVYLSGPFYAHKVITLNQPLKYILYSEINFKCWKKEDKACIEKMDLFKKILDEKYDLVYQTNLQDNKSYIYKLK